MRNNPNDYFRDPAPFNRVDLYVGLPLTIGVVMFVAVLLGVWFGDLLAVHSIMVRLANSLPGDMLGV